MTPRQSNESDADREGSIYSPSTLPTLIPTEAKITRFRVGLASDMAQLGSRIDVRDAREVVSRMYGPSPNPPPDRDTHYEAAVIEIGDRFWYQAKDVTIEVTEYEAKRAIGYPILHYCTMALKLHVRIEQAKKSALNPVVPE
jgi:hypothetical protein